MSLNHDTGHASLDALTAANGEHTPDLVATNGIAATPSHLSLLHSTSPPADSPATPVSVTPAPDVKIDLDYQEQESDVRHEPIPIKPIDSIDDFNHQSMSTISQLGSPPDSASIPIHPPSGTPPPPQGDLLPDVKMAEQRSQPTPNGINGAHTNGTVQDVVMGDATPLATPRLAPDMSMDSVVAADTSSQSPLVHHLQDDDDSKPPPAKRARMYSEADRDRDSLVHSATPPPASAAVSDAASPAPPPPSSVPPTTAGLSTTFTVQQHRFLTSTIRSLKKQKDASPFLRPVDPVALNIPHYPSIIKHPMDLSTVERKLASSNPQKPDSNHNNPRYLNVDEFIADVRLIFANCVTFNGPDHAITAMGKRVEEIFDKQLKHLPTAVEHSKPTVKKVTTPPPPPPPPIPTPAPAKKTPAVRRPSTSFPVIRRNDQNEAVGRPKREIHPPPPKDLPYAEPVKKSKKGKRVKDDGTMEQLRFCGKILTDLHKKQHYNIAHPFYEPVDWVKLEIPSYPKVIRKPMDLSTMRKKLENNEYPNASKFFDDFKLMIRNCFTFNPVGTPVNMAGVELQRLFDEKWKNLPPLHPVEPSEDEEEEDEEELQRQRAIADIESQIETMRENLDALKSKPVKEKKKKEKERPVIASTSKVPPKPPKPSTKKASTKKKPIPDDDVLSFDQKKDLSESIGKLDGAKLEKVIQIIHEGVPEIRDSTEEIELEIDLLPAAVLTKLYNFVIRPMRQQNAPKRGGRTGKGTGTGGLKRKSMDEDLEAEKIRQLEERMALFEKKEGGGVAPLPTHREVESEQSSDSSSDDSSGSDSD